MGRSRLSTWRCPVPAGNRPPGTVGMMPGTPSAARATLDDTLAAIEKELLSQALRASDGVQVAAARRLGIKKRSLHHRLQKYGIDAGAFRRNRRQQGDDEVVVTSKVVSRSGGEVTKLGTRLAGSAGGKT
ncbi:MAG: helix-turn-helix domain-containing protein [Desulfurivibrio sp.]|nr:helix-turn-helix domain-containing protein [Desulfurivibrio sp.]